MYGNGQAPIFILKDGTQRTRGRTAQSNNIAAAKAVADAVRSTSVLRVWTRCWLILWVTW